MHTIRYALSIFTLSKTISLEGHRQYNLVYCEDTNSENTNNYESIPINDINL